MLRNVDAVLGVEDDFGARLTALIPNLRAFARTLCRGRDGAEDLAQEAMMSAWKSRASFQPGINLKSWLFVIQRNAYYSAHRRKWREVEWDEDAMGKIMVSYADQHARTFDLASFSRAAPKLDLEELRRLNARLIHGLSFAAVADRLRRSGLDDVDERLWNAARSNLATVAEIGLWRDICRGQIAPKIDDREFAATAARLLPPEPWDEATWQNWTRTVAGATGRKGRELFRPLRLALTQREDGPELKIVLPLLGRARAFARLSGETA